MPHTSLTTQAGLSTLAGLLMKKKQTDAPCATPHQPPPLFCRRASRVLATASEVASWLGSVVHELNIALQQGGTCCGGVKLNYDLKSVNVLIFKI